MLGIVLLIRTTTTSTSITVGDGRDALWRAAVDLCAYFQAQCRPTLFAGFLLFTAIPRGTRALLSPIHCKQYLITWPTFGFPKPCITAIIGAKDSGRVSASRKLRKGKLSFVFSETCGTYWGKTFRLWFGMHQVPAWGNAFWQCPGGLLVMS